VISKFHTLNKRLEQNERDETISEAERQTITRHIKTEQEAMGGLDRYQKASIYGAKSSKFVCADWVVPLLRKQKASAEKHLRILDVGAIDNQYQGHEDWLDAVPIDLHGGQHESVLQVDFFDYAHEYCSGTDLSVTNSSSLFSTTTTTRQLPRPFDAIVMSLVLNFQGDPRKRGDMLALAADPRLLKIQQGGMLFVAVPSASLENSRYCDLDRFVEVVTNPLFRFELVEQKKSSKLILLAFRRAEIGNFKKRCCYNASKKTFDYRDHEMKRLHPAKPGTKRNNFAVILKSSHNRT
jgi:25S rRNA (adenine2142-N1)-methyltransferase